MPGTAEGNKKGAMTKLSLFGPNYYIEIGRRGGKRASHSLSTEKAKEMAQRRWKTVDKDTQPQ